MYVYRKYIVYVTYLLEILGQSAVYWNVRIREIYRVRHILLEILGQSAVYWNVRIREIYIPYNWTYVSWVYYFHGIFVGQVGVYLEI